MQRELEIVLTRQLASYLATPAFIVDPDGNLLFYNDPAEVMLGHRYDETGEMPAAQWATLFEPTDADGVPLPPDELPLLIALRTRRPAHREFWITGLDGARRHLVVTAMPLVGQAGRFLGAIALFWEGAAP
ncbi:MAG: PAS domain-containing protein [Deltaproteobacteria bacterium]|nr:PAS domain-containing protein [Myxococcales bacterium]MDP3219108.1 PAS domain-containing protein [Deltaproteobacteria bacterium]